ncbi:hypothetical protein [Mycobacterium avium]|uniref:hypothetical protein n=1 Tax=Mycobacterium avium TaxID=1764 RepID=UPI002671351C|nr:hypothetical protein [Mycobacterium avium]
MHAAVALGGLDVFSQIIVGGAVLVGVDVVGVAAAGQRDIGQVAAGGLTEDGVGGARGQRVTGGGSLGGVHGHRVAVVDVLGQVLAGEHSAGPISETASIDAVVVGVDFVDPPAVPVAYRVGRLGVVGGVDDGHGGVVAPRNNDITDADAMPARASHGGRLRSHGLVVQAGVESVADFPPVGHQQAVFPGVEIGLVGR